MASQLGGHISPLRHRGDGDHDITVMLHPAELGAVRIHMEIRDGVIGLTMAAAQDASASVLRDALPVLRQQLTDAGLQMGRSDVASSFDQMARDLGQSGSGQTGSNQAGSNQAGLGQGNRRSGENDPRTQNLAADGFRTASTSPAAQRISRTSATQGGLDVTI